MKLKSFECPDTSLVYEFNKLAEAYIAKNENGDVFVMSEKEVQEMLDEGQIQFDENNILAEGDYKKKKMSEKDDEDLDGDDEDKDGDTEEDEVDESKDEEDDKEEMDEADYEDGNVDTDGMKKAKVESEYEPGNVDTVKGMKKAKVESLELDFSVNLSEDDQKALFENGLISEEYADTAKTIFESAVKEQVKTLTEQVKEFYAEQQKKEIQTIEEQLKENVNDYLDYVVTEWMKENEIAIESSLKLEMNEQFIEGMSQVFEEHYIKVPEERYDIMEGLAQKIETLEEQLNSQLETNSDQLAENKRLEKSIETAKLMEGLSSNQAEKFSALLENVSYESVEEFKTKATQLKESYFKSSGAGPASTNMVDDSESFTPVNEEKSELSWIDQASRI